MVTITVEFSENSSIKVREFFDKMGKSKNIKRQDKGNKIIYSTNKYDDYDFVNIISEVLTDCIVTVYEEHLIEKIANDICKNFNKLARNRICEIASIMINEENDFVESFIISQMRADVHDELVEYLTNNKNIIIEGFINFRLFKYLEDLEYIVQVATDVYEKEKEYREFIDLLRYFVEVQVPKIDVVYVTVNANGEFDMYDKFKRDVNHLYEEEMKEDLANDKLSNEDILLGALVTMSPKKIVLNNSYEGFLESDIFMTICKIFERRVFISEW